MSYADVLFKNMCEDIINNGTDTRGEKVRPKWEDGTSAYTIKKFGVVNEYDLRKEFPALTFRKTGIKSAMDEILWIFQRKSNNINDLKPHIWDEWADEKGSIGKAYGYQIGQKFVHHKIPNTSVLSILPALEYRSWEEEPAPIKNGFSLFPIHNVYLDQIDAVIYDLRTNPFSRRIITSLWNFQDLHEMNLQPCCWSLTFNVTKENNDKLTLNMILNQRSNDVLAANNWNVVQYSLLLMMIAQVCNMEAGKLLHVIADAHIYDRHIPLVKELITREMYDAPIVKLNPEIKNFYNFTTDDIIIENYKTGPQITDIPIAI